MTMARINFDNINLRQLFSLPKPIMQYIILKPSTAKVYQKLIQTCKYFYYKNPAVLVNQYIWNHQMESLVLTDKAPFIYPFDFYYQIAAAKNSLSTSFLQNFRCCNLVDLCIIDQDITFKEYQMLTKSRNVLHFWIKKVTISYEDGTIVPVERIMERLPNIVTFKVDEPLIFQSAFSPESFQNLAALPAFQNLELFRIRAPFGPSNFNYLRNFLLRNRNNRCVFAFYLLGLVDLTGPTWLANLKGAIYDLTVFGQLLEFKCKIIINKILHHTLFTIHRLIDED